MNVFNTILRGRPDLIVTSDASIQESSKSSFAFLKSRKTSVDSKKLFECLCKSMEREAPAQQENLECLKLNLASLIERGWLPSVEAGILKEKIDKILEGVKKH